MSTDIRSGTAIGVVAFASGSVMAQPAAANAGGMLKHAGVDLATFAPFAAAMPAMDGVMDRIDAILAVRCMPRPSPTSSPTGEARH
jgi:hypothetical protein